jgi:hypothetical protein
MFFILLPSSTNVSMFLSCRKSINCVINDEDLVTLNGTFNIQEKNLGVKRTRAHICIRLRKTYRSRIGPKVKRGEKKEK